MMQRLYNPCDDYNFADLFRQPDEVITLEKLLDRIGHRLRRLWKKGKCKRVGKHRRSEKGGRDLWVYCRRTVKGDWIHHEMELTDLIEKLGWPKCRRGRLVHKGLLPDAEIPLMSRTLFLENDRGGKSIKKLKKTRFKKYAENKELFEGNDNVAVWLVPDEDRRQELIDNAQGIEEFSLFGIFSEVLADPFGDVLIDADGGKAPLVNPGEKARGA